MNNPSISSRLRPVLFVQINDIYHIDASADYLNSKSLLLPRVATLLKGMRGSYGRKRVFFCLPGDFLGLSCLSQEFKGKQMIDVLNSMAPDFVTFGNHEFDFRYP